MSVIKIKNSNVLFKVENVYCIGRNYLEHIKELSPADSKQIPPQEPVVFLKPNSAILNNSDIIRIPELKGKKISNSLQNEVELVIAIGDNGINISQEQSEDYILGYAVGIDFTLRDIQTELKRKGLPWTLSKGFLTSAPVSQIIRKQEIHDPQNLVITLKINDKIKQSANTSQMIFKINYIVHYISSIFGLKKGDLIFTGTPAGVTDVIKGDGIDAEIEKIGKLIVKIG